MGEAKRKADHGRKLVEIAFTHTLACAVMVLNDKIGLSSEQIEVFAKETREQFESVIGEFVEFGDITTFVKQELGVDVTIDLSNLRSKEEG